MAKKGFRKIKYINIENEQKDDPLIDSKKGANDGELDLLLDIDHIEENKKESLFSNLKNWITEGTQSTSESDYLVLDKENSQEEYEYEEIELPPEKVVVRSSEKIDHLKEKIMEIRTTVIAENVEIVGDVKMEGSLEFYGKITGNIDSKGDINMANAAQIEGKLRGNNLSILSGNINGDLTIDKDANLGSQSRVVGDIHAQTLNSSGMIVGNVYVSEKVVLNETSVIEGNIKARELEVKVGAVIRGQIEIDTTK